MRVWCGQSTEQLGDDAPDVIVFPEEVDRDEIAAAAIRLPQAIVVGAVREANRMRGVVWHRGSNQVDYRKVGSDGHSEGGSVPTRAPVYAWGDAVVGLLICMDVQNPGLRNAVVDGLRGSIARFKIVCIPAEMQAGAWFVGDDLGVAWTGVNVALSNGARRYPCSRLRSFLTNDVGAKAVIQRDAEPICLALGSSFRAPT